MRTFSAMDGGLGATLALHALLLARRGLLTTNFTWATSAERLGESTPARGPEAVPLRLQGKDRSAAIDKALCGL
jgi:hypothetical protein